MAVNARTCLSTVRVIRRSGVSVILAECLLHSSPHKSGLESADHLLAIGVWSPEVAMARRVR